ncbi:MAG: hypothetical protein ACJ8F7_08800 [Gemmataceae bacterium]
MPMDATRTPPRAPAEIDWPTFVETYGRAVLAWLHQTGLPAADVQALAREFLRGVAPEFQAVVNEPALRFRAWLQYAGHKCWCRLMEGRVEAAESDGETSPQLALLLSVESHDAFLRALDVECTHQRRRAALARVQPLADPPDWEMFDRLVLRGEPVEPVAAEFGCGELAARAAAYRVQLALQNELRAVEETL